MHEIIINNNTKKPEQKRFKVVQFRLKWLRRRDSNPRPYGPEPYALPTALRLNVFNIILFYLFSVNKFVRGSIINF